ncbi:MAG: glycosyltransferase family 2 protein [Desulfopila sp.]|jgi:glycosyltransferase involved in cell wall biosynthesis|nr:glycosyltransferase family 2 protein [Desulfopila sp.]
MRMNPAVIIPVYNHSRKIVEVVEKARLCGWPIVVVDDGSTDSTGSILQEIRDIILLRHEDNQGKGAALLSGFGAALERGHDWAVTIDGDGQHNPEDAPDLLESARQSGERCIVIGRRQGMEGALHVPWTSRFGRSFSNFWVWAAGGPRVEDSQSGFRLYPLPETLHLETRARRYQYEVEVLVKAQQQGMRVREVPVRVIYQAGGERVSHFRPWLDFMRNSSTFNRLIWDRLLARFRR